MSKARKEKCSIKVRYGKVLACGAGGSGKTNFFNLLMEKDFQPEHISTEVAKPQQVTIPMTAKHDDKIIFTKMDIDNEIEQLAWYLPERYTSPSKKMTPYSIRYLRRRRNSIAEDMISRKLAESFKQLQRANTMPQFREMPTICTIFQNTC